MQFKCRQKKCEYEFSMPLIFIDGDWCCPKCGNSVFPDKKTQLQVTDDNYSALFMSDKLFYDEWLPHKDPSTDSMSSRSKSLSRAIELCKNAAFANNPYALLDLGFYYERGYDDSIGGQMRFRAAELCYSAVAENSFDKYLFFNEEKPLQELKEKAQKYQDALLARVQGSAKLENQPETVEHLFEVMTNPNHDMDRAPIMGMVRLSREEAIKLSKEKRNAFGWDNYLGDVSVMLSYLKDGEASAFQVPVNENSITSICEKADDDVLWAFCVQKNKLKWDLFKSSRRKTPFSSRDALMDKKCAAKFATNKIYDFFICEEDLYIGALRTGFDADKIMSFLIDLLRK